MNPQKIIISCDTTIALTKKQIEEKGYNVIPLNAIVDGVEYHDTVDIDANKLSDLMRQGAKVSTSTPTIVEIEEYFDNLFEKTNADFIIHFTISSKLSSMFSLFTRVCEEKYGDKVKVVDSYSICNYIDQEVALATKLANEGHDVDYIINTVKETLIGTGEIVFIPDSLIYLKRGGRISPAVATIANLIGVIPILCFKDGEVGKKGVTRTAKKAFLNAIREWEDTIENFKENYSLVIMSSDDAVEEKVNKVAEILKEYAPEMAYFSSRISLNVTAHTGPGTVGLGYMKKN